MDEVIFDDGTRRLRICVSGIDRESGTVSRETFALSIFVHTVEPDVQTVFTHVLDVDEAALLHQMLDGVSIVRDSSVASTGKFIEVDVNVPERVIEALVSHPALVNNPGFVQSVLEMNPELCQTILETQVAALDISSLAYRRDQLALMRRLLDDADFFSAHQAETGAAGKEAVWQRFFEQNQWIFGYGLNYVIGEGVQPDKLEQVVAGYSIAGGGKRADALLHTRGVLRSLCYVEIKIHDTPLLHGTEYRVDVWQPSHELSGAVAQSQKTVQLAVEHLTTTFELPVGAVENGGERFFNYHPRSVVVCGNLQEFVEEAGVNLQKFSSFELYRRSMSSPDIITFDELYDRASAIVEAGFASRTEDVGSGVDGGIPAAADGAD